MNRNLVVIAYLALCFCTPSLSRWISWNPLKQSGALNRQMKTESHPSSFLPITEWLLATLLLRLAGWVWGDLVIMWGRIAGSHERCHTFSECAWKRKAEVLWRWWALAPTCARLPLVTHNIYHNTLIKECTAVFPFFPTRCGVFWFETGGCDDRVCRASTLLMLGDASLFLGFQLAVWCH